MLGSCLVGLPAQAADDRFAVEVIGQNIEINKTQKVKIKLTADDPWHMNMEYPTSMKLKGTSGLEMSKTKFRKGDASVLSEHKIVFEVPVRASAPGSFQTDATIKFAICKADSCSPASTKVKLRLKANSRPELAANTNSKPQPKTAKKTRRKSSRDKRQANKPNGQQAAASKNCGLFTAEPQCPAISVYLVNQWMLDPVWGVGLMERVLTHLRGAPTTP